MATRYLPPSPFATMVHGVRTVFNPDYKQKDGTFGYTAEQIAGLPKEIRDTFRKIEVTGEDIVEQATAAPGEKRAVGSPTKK